MSYGSCHCLCVILHRDKRGICQGSNFRDVPFITRDANGKITSRHDVPMCEACWKEATSRAKYA